MAAHPNSVVNYISEDAIKEVHRLDFGVIYFLENTIIAEINEGMIYGWELACKVIKLSENFYGKHKKVNYMANRIYDYTVIARDWSRFFSENKRLKSFCIVTHGQIGMTNIAIERVFYKEGEIFHFTSLIEALKFTGDLP